MSQAESGVTTQAPKPSGQSFSVGEQVRFTAERLAVLMPPDRRRLEGRVGTVEGHWRGTRNPVVYFAADGQRTDLRLLKVDPRQLELVQVAPPSPDTPESTGSPNDQSPPAAGDGGGNMSQSELDDLFG